MSATIVKINQDPKSIQSKMSTSTADWGHSKYIAAQAIRDIWHDVYLYTEIVDGELVAIGTAEVDGQGFLEILNLAAKCSYQGIGRRAVEQFKALAIELDTEITLMAAVDVVEFWQNMGMEIDDCYFGDEEDGVLMWQNN